MCMCFACICVCAPHACSTHRGQKGALANLDVRPPVCPSSQYQGKPWGKYSAETMSSRLSDKTCLKKTISWSSNWGKYPALTSDFPSTKILNKVEHEIPVVRRLRQEDCHEFKASLGYRISARIAWALEWKYKTVQVCEEVKSGKR